MFVPARNGRMRTAFGSLLLLAACGTLTSPGGEQAPEGERVFRQPLADGNSFACARAMRLTCLKMRAYDTWPTRLLAPRSDSRGRTAASLAFWVQSIRVSPSGRAQQNGTQVTRGLPLWSNSSRAKRRRAPTLWPSKLWSPLTTSAEATFHGVKPSSMFLVQNVTA